MASDPIDAVLKQFEQRLSAAIDAGAEKAMAEDRDNANWREAMSRIRTVCEQIAAQVEAAGHRAEITESADSIEINFSARTELPTSTGGTSFDRKDRTVMITHSAPDGLPVSGGGSEEYETLTEDSIREHVAVSLGRTLMPKRRRASRRPP